MRVFIAGDRGMVGSSVRRLLESSPEVEVLRVARNELDLTQQSAVRNYFEKEHPDAVVFAAAKVGGILANSTYPAEFLYSNAAMAVNCIHAAWQSGVTSFLYLGSTCIYPRLANQPVSEESLLTGKLEETNEAYALAKILGVRMCSFYRRQYGVRYHSIMPTNLYGPGDNYHPENSHVIPGLLRRFHEAVERGSSEVVVWGSGKPLREFLFVDDLASAIVHALHMDDPPDVMNAGSGEEVSIAELAQLCARAVGFTGSIRFDTSMPDGTPRKLADSSRLRESGWRPRYSLSDGLRLAYRSFIDESESQRLRVC